MPGTLREFLIEYRCPVVDRLQRIYAFVTPKYDYDRFLALTLRGHKHAYVQCMFANNKSMILCEASSGAYYGRDGVPMPFRQPPETEQALSKLGFDITGGDINYRAEFDIRGKRPDFNELADFMLKALHDGYGARAESDIQANAPFAPPPHSGCIPLS